MSFTFNLQAQKLEQMSKRRHIGTTTIVGISTLGTGVMASFVGLLADYSAGSVSSRSNTPSSNAKYDEDHNTAVVIRDVGIGLVVVGGIIFIIGRSDDQLYNPKLSIIAPKRNEIGLAYNF